MNELKVFENTEFGKLGIMLIDGKEYFPATKCAKILGYKEPEKAIREKCKGVSVLDTPTAGGIQKVNYMPEGDLYRLIVSSKLPAAEKFEQWVFDDVLPSIRKTGKYSVMDKPDSYTILDPAKRARRWIEEYEERKRLEVKNNELESKIEADKPKVVFADGVAASKGSILIGDLAKLIQQNGVPMGQKRLFEYLRQNGYLIKSGNSKNMPTQRYLEQGLFEVKISTVINPDGSNRETKTTKVTGKGQIYFINLFLQSA